MIREGSTLKTCCASKILPLDEIADSEILTGCFLVIGTEPLLRRMINSHKKDPETGKVPPEAMVSVVAIAAVLVPVRTCRSSSFLIRIELELQAKFREQKELQLLKFVLQLHFLPQCSNAAMLTQISA